MCLYHVYIAIFVEIFLCSFACGNLDLTLIICKNCRLGRNLNLHESGAMNRIQNREENVFVGSFFSFLQMYYLWTNICVIDFFSVLEFEQKFPV